MHAPHVFTLPPQCCCTPTQTECTTFDTMHGSFGSGSKRKPWLSNPEPEQMANACARGTRRPFAAGVRAHADRNGIKRTEVTTKRSSRRCGALLFRVGGRVCNQSFFYLCSRLSRTSGMKSQHQKRHHTSHSSLGPKDPETPPCISPGARQQKEKQKCCPEEP